MMPKAKKAAASLMLAITVCLCGCAGRYFESRVPSEPGGTAHKGEIRELSLLYSKGDSLNPYTCATKYNLELCDLLYDPLIKLDENYTVQKCLAGDINITSNEVSVTLKSALFTDGSSVGVNDVIYSFNLAKNTDAYGSAFSSVSCGADGDDKLIFKLKSPDGNFSYFLDFPIIKSESDKRKSDDNVTLPPIGCGRYIYLESENRLTANPGYHNGNVAVPSIRLIDAPDKVAAGHQLEVGAVDYYYTDLADGEMPKLNGVSRNIVLNKLVYIGINQNDGRLSKVGVRQALSAALNRSDIVSESYHSDAVPAGGPYVPTWGDAKDLKYIEESENSEIAVANLKEEGYNREGFAGIRTDALGEALSFSLLCPDTDPERNAAAEAVKGQLKAVGVSIEIETVPFAEFRERLESGNFQLFLSEIQISRNMDISSFAIEGGAVAYGVIDGDVDVESVSSEPRSSSSPSASDVSSGGANAGVTVSENSETSSAESGVEPGESAKVKLSEIVSEYKNLEASIFDVIAAFNSAMPVVPVCFKCGVCVYASDLKIAPYPTASDYFYNFENIEFK